MPLALQTIRMSRGDDPKARIVQLIEEQARDFGYVVDTEERGLARMQPLFEKLGIRVFGPDIMLGLYDRSGQYTSGKILVPDAYLEDKVQGKVGMVLAIGPLCNEQDSPGYDAWFGGHPPKIGDWMLTSVRDGLTFLCGKGLILKQVEWRYLRMHTVMPDVVM